MDIDDFITKANYRFSRVYDYSLAVYRGDQAELTIICPKHGKFEQSPTDHLRTSGCKSCVQEYLEREVFNKFVESAQAIHGQYKYESVTYGVAISIATIICPVHGRFTQAVSQHLLGRGCQRCGAARATSASRQRSCGVDKFIERANLIHDGRYSYDTASYTGLAYKTTVICRTHGAFSQQAQSHLSGYGCRQCAIDATRSDTADFIAKAKLVHDRYDYDKVEYVDAMTDVTITCWRHGDFRQRAVSHLEGHGCQVCANSANADDTDSFVAKARVIHGDRYDYSNTIYAGSVSQVDVTCKKHGVFKQIANNHTNGHGCPKCTTIIISKPQKRLIDFVTGLGFEPIVNDRSVIAPLEIDLWFPNLRLGIECHGWYRHSGYTRELDKFHKRRFQRKATAAEAVGVKLLQIYDFEIGDQVVQSIIKHHLGLSIAVGARKCAVAEVDHKSEVGFFDNNHRQGFAGSTVCYGLYRDTELMAAMSFLRTSAGVWKVQRLANLIGQSITGGASRLFAHFRDTHKPESVVTFADRRFGTGSVYRKLGFSFLGTTEPGYQYVNHRTRVSRYQCQKRKLEKLLGTNYRNSASEVDNMFDNGYRRLWDAGHYKLSWEPSS